MMSVLATPSSSSCFITSPATSVALPGRLACSLAQPLRSHTIVAYASPTKDHAKVAVASEAAERIERISTHANASSSVNAALPEALQALLQPDSQWFSWRFGSRIHYRQRGRQGPRILLVHGFGVGSFQWKSLMERLAEEHQVWALDLLGQGLSWPSQHALEVEEVRLSIDVWTSLLADFITDVIGDPVYVAGNSLGGYLTANLAAQQPSLCRGAIYLNATPFWAFMPRPDSGGLLGRLIRRVVPYDGRMPAPQSLKSVIRALWWDSFTQPETIRTVLQQVYHDRSAADEQLLASILAATTHELAVDAIVSIIFSPGTERPFGALAASLARHGLPSCLLYGREDPWVRPLWGQRLKRLVPQATYFEITPAGHCAHDEAPEAVHWCLRDWIAAAEAGRAPSLPVGEQHVVMGQDGREVTVRHVDGRGTSPLERALAALHNVAKED